MAKHNIFFGLGANCHGRGTLSYYYYEYEKWIPRNTIDNGYVGYLVEEGLLGGIACFALFGTLVYKSRKLSNFKDSYNLNNAFF